MFLTNKFKTASQKLFEECKYSDFYVRQIQKFPLEPVGSHMPLSPTERPHRSQSNLYENGLHKTDYAPF